MTEPTTLNIVSDTNFWDFLSTAATVGLPAYITYRITKSNSKIELQREKEKHKNELNKIDKEQTFNKGIKKLEIKIKLLEEADLKIQDYFHNSEKLINAWFSISKDDSINKKDDLDNTKRDEYNTIIKNYSNGIGECNIATTKLEILGLAEAREYIFQYDKPIVELSNKINTENSNFLQFNDVIDLKKKCNENKNSYQQELKNFFEKL